MSINSAVLHQHQHRQPNITVPRKQMSFLNLPIELRTAIYEYLIPNDEVLGYWFISQNGGPPDRRPVRHDKQPCCPAVLRINRQIHDEVIGMFYGTARFFMYVVGCRCYVFGMKFATEDLHEVTANKLPPGFRFIRSLHITIKMEWPLGLDVQPTLNSALPPLPKPPPATTLLANCLWKRSYELRQVTLGEVGLSPRLMPEVIHSTLEDHGKRFRAICRECLGPLLILRGVDIKFDDLGKLGGRPATIIRNCPTLSREEVLIALRRVEKIRMRAVRELVERVLQNG